MSAAVDLAACEWQATSRTAHIIDTSRPAPKRSGARSICGRYAQRNEFPWFGLSVEELGLTKPPLPYQLKRCPDCVDAYRAVQP